MTNKYAGMGDKSDRRTRYTKSAIRRHVGCVRKKTYETIHHAEAHVLVHKLWHLTSYRCPDCGKYHLTSKKGDS